MGAGRELVGGWLILLVGIPPRSRYHQRQTSLRFRYLMEPISMDHNQPRPIAWFLPFSFRVHINKLLKIIAKQEKTESGETVSMVNFLSISWMKIK